MATTTTLEPKTTTSDTTTSNSTQTTSNTTNPDSSTTSNTDATVKDTANAVFNKELMKRYGIGILSAAIAIFAFIMYRRGSWSRPVLSGMVIGAALLAVIQSSINIRETIKAKNALNA